MPIVKNSFYKISSTITVQSQSQLPKLSLIPGSRSIPGGVASKYAKSARSVRSDDNMNKTAVNDQLIQRIIASLHGQVQMIFQAQYTWSLRACEALSIRNKDIQPNGLIFIPSKKGSSSRFISSAAISSLKCFDPFYADYKVFTIGYDAYYRALKRAGMCFKLKNNKRLLCVTHAARKFNLQHIKNNTGISNDELMRYSGHKTKSGINYYLDENSLQNEEV